MACNAWNHPSNCRCGWGGVFYGSGYRDGLDDSWHWQRSDSYTIPNSRCPRCNALVFFYRSPFGGSVYFDDLGPPWPKHPCMDVGVNSTPITRGPPVPQKRTSGWRPMICEDTRRHERCDQVVVLKVQSGSGGPKRLYAVFDRRLLDYRTPFLARARNGLAFEVSTLNTLVTVPHEVRFTAYASPDGLPQPFRDMVKDMPRPVAEEVSPPNVVPSGPIPALQWQQPLEQTTAPLRKAPPPDNPQPKKVQITLKHRRPVPAVVATPRSPAPPPKSLSGRSPATTSRGAQRNLKTPKEDLQPTNMALALQKLAGADPLAEELLLTGFRGLATPEK
jgi:hypothetical protein